MKKVKKFFKILPLFVFCIKTIYSGCNLDLKHNFSNIVDVWKYCEKWEDGEL